MVLVHPLRQKLVAVDGQSFPSAGQRHLQLANDPSQTIDTARGYHSK